MFMVLLDTKTELTAHNITSKMHCTINMYALKTCKYLRYKAKIKTIKIGKDDIYRAKVQKNISIKKKKSKMFE